MFSTTLLIGVATAQHYRHEPRKQTCDGMNNPNYTDKNGNKCNFYKNPMECFQKTMSWTETEKIDMLFNCRASCHTCEAKMCEDRDQLLQGIAGDPNINCKMIVGQVSKAMCGTNLAKLNPDYKPLEAYGISLGSFCPTSCYGSKCPECSKHSDCENYEYCDMRGTCTNDYMCCEYTDSIDGSCPNMHCDDFDMDTYREAIPEVQCEDDSECQNGEYCSEKDKICTTCNDCQNAFKSPLGYDQKCHDRCRDWCNDQVMKDEEAFDGPTCFQGDNEFGRCVTCGYTDDSTKAGDASKCITCEPGFAIDLRDADYDSDCTGYCVKEEDIGTWGIGMYPCKPRAECITDGFRVDRHILIIAIIAIVGGSVCGFLLLCVLPVCICICCCCGCCKKKPAPQKPQQIIMAAPAVQMAPAPIASPMPVALPPGWTVARDPATGRNYYCNAATQQTSWTHPITGQ